MSWWITWGKCLDVFHGWFFGVQPNQDGSQGYDQAEWIANVMPVPKKDGKVRMCVDFRNLRKACPKDDFPLLHIDVLVDNMGEVP